MKYEKPKIIYGNTNLPAVTSAFAQPASMTVRDIKQKTIGGKSK